MTSALAAAAGVLAAAEVLARARRRRARGGVAEAARRPVDYTRTFHVLHPYLGFTMRPGRTPGELLSPERRRRMCGDDLDPEWLGRRANALGTWSRYAFPYAARADEFVVGLFGGSVANWFALQAGAAFERRLAGIPAVGGRRVVLLNFGIPGGKQPQQLAALVYVLSRRQRLDLAIDVDGFNELVWAGYNLERGVDFTLPSTHLLAPLKQMVASVDTGAAGVWLLADHLRAVAWADRLRDLRWRRPSALVDALAGLVEDGLRRFGAGRLEALGRLPADPERDPLPFPRAEPDTPPAALADYWRDCSLAFARVAGAHAIPYLHVLQAHPYDPGRPPSAAERAFCDPDLPTSRVLVEGYPLLVERAAALCAEGVAFLSMPDALRAEPRTVFSDAVGHLSQLGNDLMAERLGEAVERLLAGGRLAAAAS